MRSITTVALLLFAPKLFAVGSSANNILPNDKLPQIEYRYSELIRNEYLPLEHVRVLKTQGRGNRDQSWQSEIRFDEDSNLVFRWHVSNTGMEKTDQYLYSDGVLQSYTRATENEFDRFLFEYDITGNMVNHKTSKVENAYSYSNGQLVEDRISTFYSAEEADYRGNYSYNEHDDLVLYERRRLSDGHLVLRVSYKYEDGRLVQTFEEQEVFLRDPTGQNSDDVGMVTFTWEYSYYESGQVRTISEWQGLTKIGKDIFSETGQLLERTSYPSELEESAPWRAGRRRYLYNSQGKMTDEFYYDRDMETLLDHKQFLYLQGTGENINLLSYIDRTDVNNVIRAYVFSDDRLNRILYTRRGPSPTSNVYFRETSIRYSRNGRRMRIVERDETGTELRQERLTFEFFE